MLIKKSQIQHREWDLGLLNPVCRFFSFLDIFEGRFWLIQLGYLQRVHFEDLERKPSKQLMLYLCSGKQDNGSGPPAWRRWKGVLRGCVCGKQELDPRLKIIALEPESGDLSHQRAIVPWVGSYQVAQSLSWPPPPGIQVGTHLQWCLLKARNSKGCQWRWDGPHWKKQASSWNVHEEACKWDTMIPIQKADGFLK